MKMKSRSKKIIKKNFINSVPLPATFDKTCQLLKLKFSVKHINYITNNGIIQYGWLISNEQAIDEAIYLLKVQAAPVYILGEFANAIVRWDVTKVNMTGGLWKNGKEIDTIRTDDFNVVKNKLVEWYKMSKE